MHFELFVAFCNFLVFPVSIVLAAVGLNRGQNRIPNNRNSLAIDEF
jgi:hypothetical protein